MKHLFILGAYGQNNLGDDALLQVFLEQFGGAHITVNSATPHETAQRYGVDTVPTYLGWPRLTRLRTLLAADMLVFGGGSLLKEIEGGTIARLLYFARILLLLLFGKLMGRPTAMLGVGIGPLTRPLYCRLSRLAADMTDLICVRDSESARLLAQIGVRREVHVTGDPVFTLAEGAAPATQRDGTKDAAPRAIVIPRYSFTPAQQRALAAACDHLVAAYGAQVVFMPFQVGYRAKYDDARMAELVRQQMQHAHAAELQIVDSPSAALQAIGAADLVLSARLHGLIFAAMRGVTAVALNYEIKVQSFMHEIGQDWASVSLADLADGKLIGALDRAWQLRQDGSEAVRDRLQGIRQRAQQNFTQARELLAQPRRRPLLGGGALLLASMTIVNAGNYLFNLILGRWLGPAAFADLSLIITLMLVVTLITSTLQTISAKFAAKYVAADAAPQSQQMRRWMGRGAWYLGLFFTALVTLGAPFWQQFFHTASIWPFVILGLGLPFYFAQGVDRGVLQGETRFGVLSLSYQVEMWVRLLAAIGLVLLGWSVNGAVAGLSLSLLATWLVGFGALRQAQRPGAAGGRSAGLDRGERRSIVIFAGPVIAALIGQVLINNSDILIVKHFFSPAEAGQYAALALIGRIVFFATASVVAAMFPIVAQRQQRGERHRHLLWMSLGIVAGVSLLVIVSTLLFPGLIVRMLFGSDYLSIAPLLWLYAIATAFYALSNVVINYRLSADRGGGSVFAVVGGVAQVAGLWLFHSSLHEVVMVQIYLMAMMMGLLLVWDRWLERRAAQPAGAERRAHRLLAALRQRRRSLLLGGGALLILLLMWQSVSAEAPALGHPAQRQMQQILPSIRDSEAEYANGSYIPGLGAVITIDLIRGPNTAPGKPSYLGTRDWAIYLMQTFGPQLDAVPPAETIAISVNFYDFTDVVYRQLVVTSLAKDVANPNSYTIWLDGQPYAEAVGAGPSAPAQPTAAPAQPTAAPAATATPAASTVPTAAEAPTPTAGAVQPTPLAGSYGLTLDLAHTQSSSMGDWIPVNGKWQLIDQGYAQTEQGKFDLITLLNRPISGDYTLQVDLKYLEGEMGGGLVFNAPRPNSKNGAQMISYTGKGSYLQWGYFDDGGVFQYKGGLGVPKAADGRWHTIATQITGQTYTITLDGVVVAKDVPLVGTPGGRVGLLASTSSIVFNNLKVESK